MVFTANFEARSMHGGFPFAMFEQVKLAKRSHFHTLDDGKKRNNDEIP